MGVQLAAWWSGTSCNRRGLIRVCTDESQCSLNWVSTFTGVSLILQIPPLPQSLGGDRGSIPCDGGPPRVQSSLAALVPAPVRLAAACGRKSPTPARHGAAHRSRTQTQDYCTKQPPTTNWSNTDTSQDRAWALYVYCVVYDINVTRDIWGTHKYSLPTK